MSRAAATSRLAALRRNGDLPAAWVAGAAAAAWAALAGYALVLAPTLVAWLAGGAHEPLGGVLRLTAQAWLVVGGAEVVFGGGRFGLAPLGLTIAFVALLRHAGRSATRLLRSSATSDSGDTDDAGAAGSGDEPGPVLPRRIAATLVVSATGSYALIAGGAAYLAALPTSSVEPVQAAVTSAALAAVGVVLGVLPASGLLPQVLGRLPGRVRRALRPAATGAVALLAGGGALVLLAIGTHLPTIAAIHGSLDAGLLGGVVLTLGSVAYLVNAVVWAVAYAAGPGFALGVGTTVDAGGVTVGALPGLPILGALPEQVPVPVQLAALLVPLVAGGLAGRSLVRRPSAPAALTGLALDGLTAGALCGLAAGLAAGAASGPAGPRLLAQVGSVPWQVALAVTVEVGVAAAATAVVLHWRRRPRPADTPDDEPPAEELAETDAVDEVDPVTA